MKLCKTNATVLVVVEELRRHRVPGVVLGCGVLLHELPLIFAVRIANVDHLEFNALALHNQLGFHLSFLHLK